ncbi:hypothetical protein [Kitasatospora viridis]|uniref:Uncharacterized protein n=1 Tax=Kitasatospora viridis TaxID=281105 RepID=A0A561UK59_9ACTN|nr:hypothetical protein [Kitasatospora viridis]TWF99752.1 hypothetical protein FHX73_113604 [Kitasatospora viridis]
MTNRTQIAPRRRLLKAGGLGVAAGAVAGLMYLLPAAPAADAAAPGSHPRPPAAGRPAAGGVQQADQDLLGVLHWPGAGGSDHHRGPGGQPGGGHPKAPGRPPVQQIANTPGGTPPGGASAARP